MIPNDLSAFVPLLLRHCPCQSLKRNDVGNELTGGMELEEIPTETFSRVLFAFSWDWESESLVPSETDRARLWLSATLVSAHLQP